MSHFETNPQASIRYVKWLRISIKNHCDHSSPTSVNDELETIGDSDKTAIDEFRNPDFDS
jgi:hypothetical protein